MVSRRTRWCPFGALFGKLHGGLHGGAHPRCTNRPGNHFGWPLALPSAALDEITLRRGRRAFGAAEAGDRTTKYVVRIKSGCWPGALCTLVNMLMHDECEHIALAVSLWCKTAIEASAVAEMK